MKSFSEHKNKRIDAFVSGIEQFIKYNPEIKPFVKGTILVAFTVVMAKQVGIFNSFHGKF